MFKKSITRKVYFQEKRGEQTTRWYIGTVIGEKALSRTESSIFGGFFGSNSDTVRTWNKKKLLIETSDKRRVSAWETDTFDVVGS